MIFNIHAKQDIRPEFIREVMSEDFNVKRIKLKKSWINWLFRHYELQEGCINFFDAETTPADENETTHKRPITWDERLAFNNWQDPFGKIWGMSQREADQLAKMDLDDFRKAGHLSGRCWVGEYTWNGRKCLHVFLYGRDIHEFDLHLLLIKKGHSKNA